MRIGLEIEVSDKELLGRLANVKEKKEALDRAMAQLESCITSRYEAKMIVFLWMSDRLIRMGSRRLT